MPENFHFIAPIFTEESLSDMYGVSTEGDIIVVVFYGLSFLLFHQPLFINSPPFHHPLLCAGKMSASCSHIELKNSYNFNRRGI